MDIIINPKYNISLLYKMIANFNQPVIQHYSPISSKGGKRSRRYKRTKSNKSKSNKSKSNKSKSNKSKSNKSKSNKSRTRRYY